MNKSPIRYSAGILADPQDKDPRFDTTQAALDAAIATSESDFRKIPLDETVRAVWQDDTGEILFLVHLGVAYRPA